MQTNSCYEINQPRPQGPRDEVGKESAIMRRAKNRQEDRSTPVGYSVIQHILTFISFALLHIS